MGCGNGSQCNTGQRAEIPGNPVEYRTSGNRKHTSKGVRMEMLGEEGQIHKLVIARIR